MEATLWLACGLATIVAAVLANRGRRWLHLGRAAVGVLFLVGGALVNATYLASGVDYAAFADGAHFAWVTDAWRAVVAPNVVLFISLLVAFEAIVGVLILSGGRRTRLGYVGVIGFYCALWLFGWFMTVWSAVMLPPMVVLLRAERRAASATVTAPAAGVDQRPLAGIGS